MGLIITLQLELHMWKESVHLCNMSFSEGLMYRIKATHTELDSRVMWPQRMLEPGFLLSMGLTVCTRLVRQFHPQTQRV